MGPGKKKNGETERNQTWGEKKVCGPFKGKRNLPMTDGEKRRKTIKKFAVPLEPKKTRGERAT